MINNKQLPLSSLFVYSMNPPSRNNNNNNNK